MPLRKAERSFVRIVKPVRSDDTAFDRNVQIRLLAILRRSCFLQDALAVPCSKFVDTGAVAYERVFDC